jgi:hypothetical protein
MGMQMMKQLADMQSRQRLQQVIIHVVERLAGWDLGALERTAVLYLVGVGRPL